jgi:hypothetical protein
MAPRPPELTKPVEQQDQGSPRIELFSDGNVKADSVGSDILMPPRTVKKDVAYAGPCHGGGSPYCPDVAYPTIM